MIPRKLKNFSVFVDGRGYAGKVEEITLPKLTRKMEEHRAGGMNAPVEIDMGMEKLEAELTFSEYNEDLFKLWGLVDNAGVNIRAKGALEADDENKQVTPVEVVFRGRWRELDKGGWKAGDNTTLKVSVAASYYKYSSDNTELVEIDVPNMIERIGGVDRLKQQRAALGL